MRVFLVLVLLSGFVLAASPVGAQGGGVALSRLIRSGR